MAISKIDELNNQTTNGISMRSMPYEKYFGEMDLTEKEKKERIELAEKFEKEFLYILSLIIVMNEYDTIQWNNIQYQLQERYRNTLDGVIDTDDYINDYIKQFSSNIIESTKDNMDDEYMTSYDRAVYMAENESNTVYNHQELMDAIAAGKTKKKWITMHDNRVRKTHQMADGQTVNIEEPFFVGDSLMLVPKDSETYGASPQECVNCRCTVKFY